MRSISSLSFKSPALKSWVFAGLLASLGVAASAQGVTPPPPAGPAHARQGERMGHPDPAKMHAMMAKRMAAMKEKLKLTPAQEPAWGAFTASMQPPAPHARMERGEMAKLTTPERIDKMRALRAQRNAEMDQRADAAKTFYAALTPDQQKVFDANTMRHRPGGPDGRHHMPDAPAKG